MSTGRLTFLYPHLYRNARLSEQATQVVRHAPRRRCPPPPAAYFSTSKLVWTSSQPTKPSRKTSERLPLRSASCKRLGASGLATAAKEPKSTPAEGTSENGRESNNGSGKKEAYEGATQEAMNETSSKETPAQAKAADALPESAAPGQPKSDEAIPLGPPSVPTATESPKGTSGPMDAILRMPPPESEDSKIKPPQLTPPPYVHHFDSYSLVKQLSAGGYTQPQAITAMKAVRQLLASNLDIAQNELVSKSDVENETYLFRAACSELSTEVKNNRRVAEEQMRQQRTLLQHEVDILTQSLNGELLALNDSVRGMFNDRRMAVREEQKAVESTIQEINYKISITLTSDAKSEIEGLRWVLIRRSVLGIIFMAILMFGSLRYGSYVTHEKQKEAERVSHEKRQARQKALDGRHDHADAPGAAEILAAN